MSKPSPEAAAHGAPPTDRRQAFLTGAADGLRMPALVIVASMVGFGSLARDSGLGIDVAVVSTVTVWGLP